MRLFNEDGTTGDIDTNLVDWAATAERNGLRLYNQARVKGYTHQEALFAVIRFSTLQQGPPWFDCIVVYFQEV